MHLLIHKTLAAIKTYRFSLPWRIFKKLLAKIITTKTIILYAFDMNNGHLFKIHDKILLLIEKIENDRSELFPVLVETFPEKDFSSRLKKKGWQCYVASSNDKIVAYAWVITEDCFISEINYHFKLSLDEIFIYDCFVCPEFRGKGIYPNLISRIVNDNLEVTGAEDIRKHNSKVNTAYIGVESSNKASISGILKAGFIELNRVNYLQWRSFQRWWWQRQVSG